MVIDKIATQICLFALVNKMSVSCLYIVFYILPNQLYTVKIFILSYQIKTIFHLYERFFTLKNNFYCDRFSTNQTYRCMSIYTCVYIYICMFVYLFLSFWLFFFGTLCGVVSLVGFLVWHNWKYKEIL